MFQSTSQIPLRNQTWLAMGNPMFQWKFLLGKIIHKWRILLHAMFDYWRVPTGTYSSCNIDILRYYLLIWPAASL